MGSQLRQGCDFFQCHISTVAPQMGSATNIKHVMGWVATNTVLKRGVPLQLPPILK